MSEEKTLKYNEACPTCYSLRLDVIWIGDENNPSHPEIEVSCLDCGESWEDWL